MGDLRGRAEILATNGTHSSALLFRHRHCKNVVCWLKRFVCLISQSSVRSFCHLPCVFCIFQRIASFQQHPLSSHWKWKHVFGRNFPLRDPASLAGASAPQPAMLYFFPLQFDIFEPAQWVVFSHSESSPFYIIFFFLIMHTFEQFQDESKGF